MRLLFVLEVIILKTLHHLQMRGFEGKDIKEFAENFNRSMEWVLDFSQKFDEPVVDLQNLRGYVIFRNTEKVAENYRDQLDLYNLRVTCGQCDKFRRTKYSWGECDYCNGELRMADECCDRFFTEWQNGECWLKKGEEKKYEEAINEFRSKSLCDGKRPDAI